MSADMISTVTILVQLPCGSKRAGGDRGGYTGTEQGIDWFRVLMKDECESFMKTKSTIFIRPCVDSYISICFYISRFENKC